VHCSELLSLGLGLVLGIVLTQDPIQNQERLNFESTFHIVCSIDQNTIQSRHRLHPVCI